MSFGFMNNNDDHKDKHDRNKESSLDFDNLLDGLLLNTNITTHSNKKQNSLKSLLAEGIVYEEDFNDELSNHLKELKVITESIESRLVDIHQPFESGKFKINYAQELNTQQLAAVRTLKCPLLVIAGAGSGKTRIITYKVSYLIEQGYEPNQLLLLTFTRKAANEMLSRVQQLLGSKSITGVLGGTFHAFANFVLRKYHVLIGLPANFTIVDSEDVADIISLLKTELNLTPRKGSKHFPKSTTIQTILSKAKNLELEIKDTILEFFPENEPHISDIEKISKVLLAYKHRSNLMDYDDLIDTLRNKLRENEVFRKTIQKQVAYTLVDEYQDTNNIQREIVELIAADSRRITIVGDDAQSIYSFRGANFENILRFPQSFPDCKVVKIEENYRSSQPILDFTNDIALNARVGFKKKLFSKIKKGKKPLVKRLTDTQAEAEFIVDTIMAMKENDLEYSDFAVLTRASWQSNFVQAELMKRNIPFVVVGGIKFGERRHVKDMVSFLKILMNPMDAVAWHRILKLLEGIGDVRAKEIIALIHQQAGNINPESFVGKKHIDSLKPLMTLLNELQKFESPAVVIPRIYEFYKPILQQLEDDFEARKIDLEIFAEIAGKYDDLEKFLADFTLEPPANRYQDKSVPFTETDEKPLRISTIHSAKGLEWYAVFIPFVLDGIIPSVRSLGSLQELEEERRLFYVACSRAKEHLFLTMPAYVASWNAVFTKPTRFLNEISKLLYDL
jgi:DNA helicase-2/ATP-dependent DNA helicase PcrA